MIDEATLAFIKEHCNDDVRGLALQATRYSQVDMRVAATQIEGPRAPIDGAMFVRGYGTI